VYSVMCCWLYLSIYLQNLILPKWLCSGIRQMRHPPRRLFAVCLGCIKSQNSLFSLGTFNSLSDFQSLWILYRSYLKGISVNIELQVYSVTRWWPYLCLHSRCKSPNIKYKLYSRIYQEEYSALKKSLLQLVLRLQCCWCTVEKMFLCR
jgi:hypothetical protein